MGALFGNKASSTEQEVYTGIQVSTSMAGGCIPLVYGRQRIPFNLLWYGNFTGSNSGGGGKMGGGGSGTTVYSAAFLAGLCVGPIVGVNQIWHDKALETLTSENMGLSLGGSAPAVWSFLTSYAPPGVNFTGYISGLNMEATAVASGNLLENQTITGGGTAAGTKIVDMGAAGGGPGGYTVNIAQTVYSSGSPGALVASAGAAGSQAIPYDHIAYVATDNYDLGSGAAMPNLNFEVDAFLGYNIAVGMYDCDPSAIITDYLTDPNHGAGFLGAIAALTGTTNTWQSCVMAQNLMFSPYESTQRQASSFLADLMQCTNSDMFVSAGTLKVFSYYDNAAGISTTTPDGTTWSYTPNLTPIFEFNDDDYLYKSGDDPVIITRKPLSETHNNLNVQYKDRSDYYNNGVANSYDLNDIRNSQLRTMDPLTFDMITSASVARTVGQLILNADLFQRETAKFSVRADFAGLEPGDVIAFTDTVATGLINQLARVTATDDSDDDTFTLTVLLISGTARSTPVYNWIANQGFAADYNVDPGNVQAPAIFLMPPIPASLGQGMTVGIATGGASLNVNWGGAQIWCSLDGTTYDPVGYVGPQGLPCYGLSTSSITALPSIDTTNTLSIALTNTQAELSLATTTADAAAALTLVLVDSGANAEVIAYGACTAGGGAGDYNLSYLYRGLYGTKPIAHASGVPVVRLDGTIFQIAYDPGQAGATLHYKFLSYNTVGRTITEGVTDPQTLAAVTAYTYTLPNAQAVAGVATLVPRGSCSITDETVYKPASATNAWDSDSISIASYQSVSVSAQVSAIGTMAVGFSTTSTLGNTARPSTSTSYTLYINTTGSPVWEVYAGGSLLWTGPAPVKNDLAQVTYDGFTCRFYLNSAQVATQPAQGLAVYVYTPMETPGTVWSNVETTVGALATPSQFITNGNAVVNNTNAMKQGGANVWDCAVWSVIGYQTCHITGKVNSVATGNQCMIGLSTSPVPTAANISGGVVYSQANYALYNESATNTWQVYEAGGSVLTLGNTPAITDVAAITYDGSTITYFMNGTSVRTVSVSGLTLYGFCPFYGVGAGINSLRFGPTTNLALVDTSQVTPGAITSPVSSTYSTATAMVSSNITYVSVTVVVPTGQTWSVLATGQADATLGSSPTGSFRLQLDGTTVQQPNGFNSNMSNLAYTASFNYTASLAAGSHTFTIQGIDTSGGATFEDAALTVSLLKR